jgi:hypothetical protein
MKTTFNIFASLIFLLIINTAAAQYGNGYGNGYGRGNSGMNQMGAMSQRSEPEKPKETPPEEIVANYMGEMKPALSLDELQTLAISNVLIETVKAQGRISKLHLSPEEEGNEYKLLAESNDKKINNFLNKDQKEKYLVFKEEMKKPRKSKSKEKKK